MKSQIREKKSSNILEISLDGKLITDPLKIANSFNKVFVEIGPKLADELPQHSVSPKSYIKPTNCNFYFKAVTENDNGYLNGIV